MGRWFKEVWNEGRIQTIYDLFAPDGITIGEHEDGKPLRDLQISCHSQNVFVVLFPTSAW